MSFVRPRSIKGKHGSGGIRVTLLSRSGGTRYSALSMQRSPAGILRWLFDPRFGPGGRHIPRWIFLRALAAIYFSAFYSLLFQIKGLMGPQGILPAQDYLAAIAQSYSDARYLYAPSVFWLSASSAAL